MRARSHIPERLRIDAAGVVCGAAQIPSPNCDERPVGTAIDLIVVHGISLPPGEFGGAGIVDLFTNRIDPDSHPYFACLRDLRVSAHFLIRRDGSLLQFVPCAMRAWHAGVSSWRGRARCNDFSIGIELEGTDHIPYAEPQYEKLRGLIALLARTYPIAGITGHSDIAPGRKTDPGPFFDWSRIERPGA